MSPNLHTSTKYYFLLFLRLPVRLLVDLGATPQSAGRSAKGGLMMGTKKVGTSAGPRTEAKLILAQVAGI